MLQNDVFGEGECACKDETFRYNSSAQCWPMYKQGPCREGEVLQPPVTSTGATCKIDRCRAYNFRNTGNRSVVSFLFNASTEDILCHHVI